MVRSWRKLVELALFGLTGAIGFAYAGGPDAVGGGYTGNGILGSYFASPDLSGSAAFTRRDVRIDFD